jgi:hypothetical protein
MQQQFTLRMFPREALARYIHEVDALMSFEATKDVDPEDFATESILMHGGDPETKDQEEMDLVKVHKGLAKSYIDSHLKGVPPIVIAHMEVCGYRLKPKWRTSNTAKRGRTTPAGRYSQKMVELWEIFAEIGLRELKDATPRTKMVFCAALHDALIVLRPFIEGNARTARLVVQPIRRQLGLYPMIYRKDDEIFHESRIDTFHDVLAPVLQRYNFT